MNKVTFVLVFLGLLVAPSFQFGYLYVDWILANNVAVQVEDMLVSDTTLLLDYIEGLTSSGVYVEDVNFSDGSVWVPGDATVQLTGTVNGVIYANGGIKADSQPSGGWSFTVADDSGDTWVKGLLSVWGGINADNGQFTVAAGTGETRVANALLRADGGIDVGNGLFTVNDNDGSFRTVSDATIEEDIFLGTSANNNRFITRVASAESSGGLTIIKGQDAATTGGDLVLTPGVGGNGNIGRILFGRADNDNLYIGRSGIENTYANGGTTTFAGQDAGNGDGGDVVIAAGDSTGTGMGGNIVLAVGMSESSGAPGVLYLGTTVSAYADFDLLVTRPSTTSTPGSTTFQGQSSTEGDGGDLYLQAGNNGSSGTPGDIVLEPGVNVNNALGNIYLGPQDLAADLWVTRFTATATAGGDTYFHGQDSTSGQGGDIYLEAGSSTGGTGHGGDIYLQPGSVTSGTPGAIYWGSGTDPLLVRRTDAVGAGSSTTITGQDSTYSNGGALTVQSGSGATFGGALSLIAGSGSSGVGGSVVVSGGQGNTFGGSVAINGGSSTNGGGGDINLTAGSSNQGAGGDISIQAGTGATNGNVVVGPTASQFIVNAAIVNIYNSYLLITQQGTGNQLRVSADPNNILQYSSDNGSTWRRLLKDRVDSVQVDTNTAITITNVYDRVARMQGSVLNIANALCAHGLVNFVNSSNQPISCPFPSDY